MKIDFEIAFSIFETIRIVKNKIKSVFASDSNIKTDDITTTTDIL